MRLIVLCLVASFSTSILAKTVSKRQVDDLERRVSALERNVAQLSSMGTDSTTGLKIKDSQNQIKKAGVNRSVASNPQLSDDQKKEIVETLENYKKKQQESQKLLDELMNEDF